MQKLKLSFLFLIVLTGSIFFFGPRVPPENFQVDDLLNKAENSDVIIIFNSGGWGNTPLEEAKDFSPIIEGIQETLNNWGLNAIVLPYNRTKDGFWGKITGIKEFSTSFKRSSEDLADKIEILNKKLPDKNIIMAGLSNGASFVIKTYEKISGDFQDSVCAIAVGTPFWLKTEDKENVLEINDAKDNLATGNIQSLFLSLLKGPFNWIYFKVIGKKNPFTRAFVAQGHNYSWSSLELRSEIVNFLEKRFKN